jgi:hypothetical protein
MDGGVMGASERQKAWMRLRYRLNRKPTADEVDREINSVSNTSDTFVKRQKSDVSHTSNTSESRYNTSETPIGDSIGRIEPMDRVKGIGGGAIVNQTPKKLLKPAPPPPPKKRSGWGWGNRKTALKKLEKKGIKARVTKVHKGAAIFGVERHYRSLTG